MSAIQSRTRTQIRTSILRALGGIAGTATGTQTGDDDGIIDTFGLQGGDDEHNGKALYMTKTAGVAATDKTWVTDYAGTTHDATLVPAVSGIVAVGDTYELYPRPFIVDDVNDVIDRAIIEATGKTLLPKVTTGNFTQSELYEYDWLTNFKALNRVEYLYKIGTYLDIHMCDVVWDELVDGDVTASVDTQYQVEGNGCLKLVVAAGCAANDILATDSISSLDLSDCDQVEITVRSTVALAAGDIHLLLDNTASCATPLETLDIPLTAAGVTTTHIISLANPTTDTAIISVGLEMETDKGAFTLYVDRIKAVKSTSKQYVDLNPGYWEIVKGSTNYLKFTQTGYAIVGSAKQVRLSGLQLPTIMTADTDTCEIDPSYVIEYCLAYLMLYHAKARSLDIENRADLGKLHLQLAEVKKQQMSTSLPSDTVSI